MEGAKLLSEAVSGGADVQWLIVSERALQAHGTLLAPLMADRPSLILADSEIADLAETEAPQGILAAVLPSERRIDWQAATLVVVLEEIQDPGNAGAILRSAWAYGADGVLFSRGTVDRWNPKVIRASAGAVFHVPLQQSGREALPPHLMLWSAIARGGVPLPEVDLRQPTALVFGNEGAGLREASAHALTVPMPGRAESLNVAMAAATCLYEAARQRLYRA